MAISILLRSTAEKENLLGIFYAQLSNPVSTERRLRKNLMYYGRTPQNVVQNSKSEEE
jgi:hypothetical protein